MTESVTVAGAGSRPDSVAPWWHTILILGCIAAFSIAGATQHGLAAVHLPGLSDRASGYVTTIAGEWLVVLMIMAGLRLRGQSIGSLVSGSWPNGLAVLKDLGLGVAFFVIVAPAIGLLIRALGADGGAGARSVAPTTIFELVVFIGASATAGFCEELIFRGYLNRQFAAWTGSSGVAIVLQAVTFGLGHGYYDALTMLAIMVLGALFGLFAAWRKSLRPGMLAHGLQDTIGGVVAYMTMS